MERTSRHRGRYLDAVRSKSTRDQDLIDAVRWGEGVGDDEHLRLVLEAMRSASTDDDLWLIGDGPVEEGLLPRPRSAEQLRALRQTDPLVARLFVVMKAYHQGSGRAAGYWDDH